MKFEQQTQSFDPSGTNVDIIEERRFKNGPLLPEHVRCLICGPSGCGKTQLMINLLTQPNGLKFQCCYVYSKTLYQSKYKFLEQVFKKLPEIQFTACDREDELISPAKARPFSVMIFDDIICEKQKNLRAHFCTARHKNIDIFYLTQCYTKVGKHLIRDNANLIIIFKTDDLNLRHVYEDHCASDMDFKTFKNVCMECWKGKFGFLTVDKESGVQEGRYRKGLDTFCTAIN